MSYNGVAKPQAGATDLGLLWSRALDDYKAATGHNLDHMKAESIDEIARAADKNAEKFSHFRNKGSKVDKVRSAFGTHLDAMQKCWRGIEIVGAAAGAFPPAMPVGVVFAACGRLLAAFAGVKADYDKVEDFFIQSSRFFERLSLIQNKTRDVGPLQTAIVRVFATQLTIFGDVEKNTKKEGARFKAWLNALWDLQDPKLASALANMQAAIDELSDTVGFASYAAIKDTQDVTADINEKTDKINENLQKYRSEMGENMQAIYESNLDLKAQLTDFVAEYRLNRAQTHAELHEEFTRVVEHIHQASAGIMKAVNEKSKPDAPEMGKRKQAAKGSGKGDAGDKKFKALRSMKNFFDEKGDIFPSWRDAQRENSAQQQEMRESFIDHTGEWIAKEPAFQQWTDGKQPLLWIKGPEGIGKTFLAYASFQKIRSQEDGRASIAYFSFKEDFPYLQSVQNAFACAALQVAESNTRYAEQVASKLKDDDKKSKDISMGRRLFLSPFATASQSSNGTTVANDQLYLVFDGLDEAREQEREAFLHFLEDLKKEKSRVHILVTSRTGEAELSEELEPLVIEATKQKMLHDMRTLISTRLNTLSRLKKFSPLAKRVIRKKVSGRADGMLYVEHMLRRLSYIGREGAVRKELDKMPDNLHDLYKLMLDECRRNRSKEQYEALKRLFAWLAFSKRSLSLAEASELVKLTVTKDDFDIEDEIVGRSARILELSRTRNVEDDIKDELKDDDNEDHDDDRDLELNEYRNDALTFQERSLRQYFKAVSVDDHGEEELRTPASAAHLTILTMCVDVLMNPANGGDAEEASELRRYAVKYWYEHFNELDPAASSSEEIGKVLALVHRITSNENNVAKVFYKLDQQSEIYPKRGEESTKPWYDRLTSWAEKGVTLPNDLLTPEVRTWAAEVVATPKDVLIPLARGHVDNWLAETDGWYIVEAYQFAEAILMLAGRLEKVTDDPLKTILGVVNAFGTRSEDAAAMRAIGVKLYSAHYDIPDEERKKKIQSDAISYLKRAVDSIENDKMEKAHTLLVLGDHYASQEEYQNAIDALDASLANFADVTFNTDSEKQKKKMDDVCRRIYLDKAWYLFLTEKKDTALDMYNEARNLTKDGTIGGWWLDDITRILDEKRDPDGHRLMDALKSWTEKERNSWFETSLDYWADLSALGRMYRAAKLTGETDTVLEWLNAFGRTLHPRSLVLFNLKAALADFYNRVLDNVDKAKEEMRTALSIQPKVDGSGEDMFNERISAVRMTLAGIIFSQFRNSCDPQRKEALLEEMKTLPGMRTDNEFRESHIGMLIANMLRIMGPAREYQKVMEGIFKTCIDGLEDNISLNDGDSLRLLAKVLGSLDGLERDARITFSSQFSILDKSIYENGASSGAASESGEAEGSSEQTDTATEETTPKEIQADGEGQRETNPVGNGNVNGKVNGEVSGDVRKDSQEEVGKEVDRELNGAASGKANEGVDGASGTMAEEKATAAKTSDVEPQPTSSPLEGAADTGRDTDAKAEEGKEETQANNNAADSDKPKLEPLDDDTYDYGIACDGGCGRLLNRWTEPFYLCLICPNTDLCEECHAKRLAWNQTKAKLDPAPETESKPVPESTSEPAANSEPKPEPEGEAKPQQETESKTDPETAPKPESNAQSKSEPTSEGQSALPSWTTFCSENHHYIKGPMKGWKGIKNGIIRIDDEELTVKDWIKGLKEERWPKAWEKYWRRQGGLKDIDVE